MTEPSMTQILENVEVDQNKDPSVNRFAPPRIRTQSLVNAELENIQHDIRKGLETLAECGRRLQAYSDNFKTTVDSLTRSVG